MKRNNFSITIKILGGSGCGSVGKTVASDTRGLRFESSHRQNLYWTLFTDNCIEKTKIKKKRPWMAHFEKNNLNTWKSVLLFLITQYCWNFSHKMEEVTFSLACVLITKVAGSPNQISPWNAKSQPQMCKRLGQIIQKWHKFLWSQKFF